MSSYLRTFRVSFVTNDCTHRTDTRRTLVANLRSAVRTNSVPAGSLGRSFVAHLTGMCAALGRDEASAINEALLSVAGEKSLTAGFGGSPRLSGPR